MQGRTDHMDSHLVNEDLAPVRARSWKWFDYVSLWMSNVHSIGGYITAGSLFAMGLPAGDVFIALVAGIVVIQVICNLVAQPSFHSGAPYPVMARMAFGVRGAVIPGLVRGIIAVGWYGIQTWLASNAVLVLLLRQWPDLGPWADVRLHGLLGLSTLGWGCFLFLWGLQGAVFWRGMETIRRFIDWAGPVIYVVMIGLDGWLLWRAGGHVSLDVLGVVPQGMGARMLGIINATALIVAYFSPIALNFGDFSRYGISMADIRRGNFWGLPVNFIGFSVLTLLTIVLTRPVFGRLMVDPVEVVSQIDSPTAVALGVLTFVTATAGVNIVANFVSAAFDFSNMAPHAINWRRGGLIAAVGAIVVTPWNLYARPDVIHLTLDILGTFIGPLTGVLLADYYIMRKGRMDMGALYTADPQAPYWYRGGINVVAMGALLFSVLCGLALVFAPLFAPVRNLSWFVGFSCAIGSYVVMARLAAGGGQVAASGSRGHSAFPAAPRSPGSDD
ncbi:NCS1 family nucleobase:cation symporter-1 [Komagataeibacter rhaeticus]|uniref:NCS1 family nucleobase:cation symporter-1 n=2 Tax=Komagataeibacter rhaeticus TaxID=215221 RepID=UPI000680C075|nr:NCS1 family nucleobase:cation symporter-1 [Komagataeibacter rhaeticus]WPP22832.1 NCS1 family nucleobase:cation symporter-1 [Komagataeibacter rhaeticus]SAY48439.1 putative allantoin permease [Komagataeibacter rhaeticus]